MGEPVVLSLTSTNEASDKTGLADFGAACSRWLQLNVGGQGELEQTPLWSQIEASRRELKRANWCLAAGDVAPVRRMLGVTHVVLGTIATTSDSNYELKYQVVDADNPKPKSPKPPVVLTLKGTKAEILAQLPAQAVQLSKILGVKSPQTPASVGLDADAMTLLGKGGWVYAEKVTPDEVKQIGSYASQEPLAALLALEYNDRDGTQADWEYQYMKRLGAKQSLMNSELKRTLVDDLLKACPQNSLAQAEICLIDPHQILPDFDQLVALNKKYPYSYAFNTARTLVELSKGNGVDAARVSQYVVSGAEQNPYSWLLAASSLSYWTGAIREGRTADEITSQDWVFLNRTYGQWQQVSRQAATLDPQNIEAWKALAEAATFNGDEVTADGAFWKAYKLNPDDADNIQWGLQMYQPKWGGDPIKLAKVLAIAKTPSHLIYLGSSVAGTLRDLGEDEQATAITQQTTEVLEAQASQHRDDVYAVLRLAAQTQTYNDYNRVLSLRLDSSAAYWLWGMRESQFSAENALMDYQVALRLDPRNNILRREVAIGLLNIQRTEEGIAQLEIYLKDFPKDIRSLDSLGRAYYSIDKIEPALSAYSRVLQFEPQSREPDVYVRLCDLQTRLGQFDKALTHGRKAVELYPDIPTLKQTEEQSMAFNKFESSWAYAFYGVALWKRGHVAEAITRCQQALDIYSLNPVAYECLGEIYWSKNQKDKAREQWELGERYGTIEGEFAKPNIYYGKLATTQLKKYAAPTPPNDVAPTKP